MTKIVTIRWYANWSPRQYFTEIGERLPVFTEMGNKEKSTIIYHGPLDHEGCRTKMKQREATSREIEQKKNFCSILVDVLCSFC